ncbi:uncharacterized protein LOC144995127 [Oryzias latipes]
MVKDFTKPAAYTGELIGVEYLYQQTGSVLEDVSLDPDAPDEAAAVTALQEEDEGIEEDEDATISGPVIISSDTAARSGDPAGTSRSGSLPVPSTTTEEDVRPGYSQNSGQHPSSDSEEEVQGPDGQPGYQYVLKLAKVLVEIRSLPASSNSRVDRIITLWKRLPDCDKQRVVYPAGIGTDSPKGASRPQRGRALPVLGRRVSNAAFWD